MNIIIDIHYIASGNRGARSVSFQLVGRKPEMVAYLFWKQIKKEMAYHADLEKVVANSNQDITQLVKDLEEQEWRNKMEDNLSF